MNLSPQWVEVIQKNGWEAVHWSSIGDARATDHEIMDYARAQGYVVFTHDLDFGTLLALTRVAGPSVIQIRAQDVMPEHLEPVVVGALRQYQAQLAAGALVVVDEEAARVRVLPLRE